MKVNDALVTFEELSTMGFPVKAGTNPPINNKCVTKGEVNTYYTVDTTVSPFSTYTDNRCPVFSITKFPASGADPGPKSASCNPVTVYGI